MDDRRTRADIEPILREVVEILVRDYQPELIILYGMIKGRFMEIN